MADAFTIKYTDEIATLLFDLPESKVNIFNSETMAELNNHLDVLRNNVPPLKGLIISSGKDNSFIAGADLKIIEQICSEEEAITFAKQGQQVFTNLADLPFPTVAAIHGPCLGGGTELALACTYRVVSNDTRTCMGLPETQLGIIPGFGGTQRLPRLVGIPEAIRIITTGAKIYPKKALRSGLVNEVVHKEHLLKAARKKILKHTPGKRPTFTNLSSIVIMLNKFPYFKSVIFKKARAKAEKRIGKHYPAIFAAIGAIEEGMDKGLPHGLHTEAQLLGKMAITSVSKNLLHVFRLKEKFSHVDTKPAQDFTLIGIVGAGVMGGGIATLLTEHSLQARLIDISTVGLGHALSSLSSLVTKKQRKGIYSAAEAGWIKSRVSYDTVVRGVQGSDAIIEAVVERMDVKKSLFSELSTVVNEKTLLLSNTSSLSITELAESVPDPARVAGLHFFNPVDRMRLVEVIFGEKTSEETVNKTMALARRLGKIPVLVKDRPGFIVNRLLLLYLNEAARLLETGVAIDSIDKALTEFGMGMGPFKLLDMVGLDIASHVATILHREFGDRMRPSPLLSSMTDLGRLGKKTGKGFYLYHQQKEEIDPEIYKALLLKKNDHKSMSDTAIIDRLIMPMVNEAASCLDEGVVDGPEAIDVAMIFGAGFPPYTGGLMRYADKIGLGRIIDKLEALSESIDERFYPSDLLRNLSVSRKGFYSGLVEPPE